MAPIHDERTALEAILPLCDPRVGDDAAVLGSGAGRRCISTDSTVLGVHAPAGTTPHALGRRAAARAISDLAAMGAAPEAMTCAVLVPPDSWEHAVAAVRGLAERGAEQGMPLAGGDLCRIPTGALALVVTVVGRQAAAIGRGFATRAGARVGDLVVVTGPLGAAGHALHAAPAPDAPLPEPPDRIRVGIALARHATAMIDLSDGLATDAAHVARAAGASLELDLDALPLAPGASAELAATHGDDYELLATLPPTGLDAAHETVRRADPAIRLTVIGRVVDGDPQARFTRAGAHVDLAPGFVHR